jgi:hypothetical protein
MRGRSRGELAGRILLEFGHEPRERHEREGGDQRISRSTCAFGAFPKFTGSPNRIPVARRWFRTWARCSGAGLLHRFELDDDLFELDRRLREIRSPYVD